MTAPQRIIGALMAIALPVAGCSPGLDHPAPKRNELVKATRVLLAAYDQRDVGAVGRMLGPQWRSKVAEQLGRYGGQHLRDARISVADDFQDSYVVDIRTSGLRPLRTNAFWSRAEKTWSFNPLTEVPPSPSPIVG